MIERNGDVRRPYNTKSKTKFKASVIKSNLCVYSNAYIFGNGSITVVKGGADDAAKLQLEIINNQYLKIVHRLLTE